MRNMSRLIRPIILGGLALEICLIAWLAIEVRAQDPPVPEVKPAGQDLPAPAVEQDLPVPRVEKTLPAPTEPTELSPVAPAPVVRQPVSAPIVDPDLLRELPGSMVAPVQAPLAAAPAGAGASAEDPEKAALAFAQQNQKLAESHVKALRDEEAKLRARLQKVEAGIKRWETLLIALEESQGVVAVTARPHATDEADRRATFRNRRGSEPPAPANRKSLRPKAEAHLESDDIQRDLGVESQ
jgi:hypothetical protein